MEDKSVFFSITYADSMLLHEHAQTWKIIFNQIMGEGGVV